MIHDAYPLGQVEHVVDVVAYEKDPDPLALELPDEAMHLCRLRGPKSGRRLVHDQGARVEVDRSGDRDRLALTSGEAEDRRLEILEVRVEATDDFPRSRFHGRVVEGAGPHQLSTEEDIRRRIEIVGQGQSLVDRFDPERLRVARVCDRDRLAVHQDLSRIRRSRSR